MSKLFKFFFIILLINTYYTMNAQLKFSIESINVSNYYIKLTDSVYSESDYNGPHLLFRCKLLNTGDSNITIYPKSSDLYISFHIDEVEFITEAIPLLFLEKDSVNMNGGDSIYFDLDSYISLGTKFLENKTGDYSSIMLRILPTIYIIYKDINIKIRSSRIKDVTLE